MKEARELGVSVRNAACRAFAQGADRQGEASQRAGVRVSAQGKSERASKAAGPCKLPHAHCSYAAKFLCGLIRAFALLAAVHLT